MIYKLFWSSGKTEFVSGKNIEEALRNAGYENSFPVKHLNDFQKINPEYRFRNYSCDIVSENALWYVSGTYQGDSGKTSGILEWCKSEIDAHSQIKQMRKNNRFDNLEVGKYQK